MNCPNQTRSHNYARRTTSRHQQWFLALSFLACFALKNIPVQIFQGGQDKNLPIEDTENFVERLRKVGGKVDLTVLPEGDHFIADEVYSDPKLHQILAKKSEFVLLVNPLSMAQVIQSFWVGQVESAVMLNQEDTLSPITIWGCGQRRVGFLNNVGTQKSLIVCQENPMVE